jgi:rod shape determining protein RodA
LFFVLGAVIFWITSRVSFRLWQSISGYLYGGLVIALIITQLIATVARGTRSWIEIGPFHMQPSQLAIVIAGLALGKYLEARPKLNLFQYLSLLVLIVLPAVIIFVEPDLGTAAIYLMALSPALLVSKVPKLYMMWTGTAVVAVVALSWMFLLKPYQRDRISSFMSNNDAQHAASYNAVQSMIAVGSGGAVGRGLGQGTQSQLRFLPERQTDFVFASFAEETGFVGGALLIGLYATLVGLCLLTAAQAQHTGAALFALVTAVMFLAQIGVNIGMNIGLVPITGITLPFVSYGGSSILALSFHLGCIQSLLRQFHPKEKLFIR